jgi:hypothetical protein
MWSSSTMPGKFRSATEALLFPAAARKRAPGFDKNHWPDMAEPGWRSQIYSHYHAEPYWEEEDQVKTFRGGVLSFHFRAM